jgi:hypothetical protein
MRQWIRRLEIPFKGNVVPGEKLEQALAKTS